MTSRTAHRLISLAILLSAAAIGTAASASCDRTGDERAIRNAVDSGGTIVISSKGTFVEGAIAPRRANFFHHHHHALPAPALKIAYEDGSTSGDDADLQRLVARAKAGNRTVAVTVLAFAADDDCRALRLAQERAAASHDRLIELGADPARLRIRSYGGRSGHDRAIFRLMAGVPSASRI